MSDFDTRVLAIQREAKKRGQPITLADAQAQAASSRVLPTPAPQTASADGRCFTARATGRCELCELTDRIIAAADKRRRRR